MSRTFVPVVFLALMFAASAAKADPKADQIIKQYLVAVQALKTLQADVDVSGQGVEAAGLGHSGRLAIVRPGRARQDFWDTSSASPSKPHEIIVADGRYIESESADGSHTRVPESAESMEQARFLDLDGALSQNPLGDLNALIGEHPKYIGVRRWMGERYDVIEGSGQGPYASTSAIDLYFGSDHLIRRMVGLVGGREQGAVAYRNMVVNARVSTDKFSLNLPSFARNPALAGPGRNE